MKIKVSKNPTVNFRKDAIQFPRLIAELEAAGAFTPEVMQNLRESTDLTTDEINQLVDRAQNQWKEIKSLTLT